MNYPTGVKKDYEKEVYHGNRGMALEDDINETNQYYLNNNIAVIHKKPTPISIRKVDYPSRLEQIIMEFTKENILILKQKKRGIFIFHLQIYTNTKLNIYEKL